MRVLIRSPTLEDQDVFVRAARRSKRLHRGWVIAPRGRAGFLAYLDRLAGELNRGFLVCLRQEPGAGALVGVININNIVRAGLQGASLGFYALAPHEGRGYMSEGLVLVLREAFTRLRLHRLEANIQPDNERSLALVQRLGFAREGFSPRFLKLRGRWRDHERWALTAEGWRAARGRYPR